MTLGARRLATMAIRATGGRIRSGDLKSKLHLRGGTCAQLFSTGKRCAIFLPVPSSHSAQGLDAGKTFPSPRSVNIPPDRALSYRVQKLRAGGVSLNSSFSTSSTSTSDNTSPSSFKDIDDHLDAADEVREGNDYFEAYDDERISPKSIRKEENPELKKDPEREEPVALQEDATGWKRHLPFFLRWTPRVIGAGGLAYVFTKASLYITTNLMSITLTDAVWFGFLAGFGTAAVTATTTFGIYSTFDSVRPEPVHKMAMEKLVNDPEVIKLLGPVSLGLQNMQAGYVRAYKIDGGDVGIGKGHRGWALPLGYGSKSKLVWRYPRIQMNFQIYGSKYQSLVTVEAINKRGKTMLNMVALDVLDSELPEHQEPYLVHGKPERLYIRDQLTGFIGFKKNYLKENVPKYA